MQIVCCAIQRVDYPEMIGLALRAGFLCLNSMVRIVLVDDFDNGFFSGDIRRANEIVTAFHFNSQLIALVEISSQYGTGATRRHYRYVE